MKVFICHSSDEKRAAQEIAHALRGRGLGVFLDEDDLPPGGEYHSRIHLAIQKSDLFVFLISRTSITPGRYTLSELAFAKEKWRNPANHVIPVLLDQTLERSLIDPYLLAVTLLQPKGNVAAEVSSRVARIGSGRTRGHTIAISIGAAIVCVILLVTAWGYFSFQEVPQRTTTIVGPVVVDGGQTVHPPPIRRLHKSRIEVTIDSLTPNWHDFAGQKGVAGQDEIYLRICSSEVGIKCAEHQLGVSGALAAEMPAGLVTIAIFNFATSPPMTVTLHIDAQDVPGT